jgi:hypothetical protein
MIFLEGTPFEQRGPMMMNNSTHEFERLLGKGRARIVGRLASRRAGDPFRNGRGRGRYNSKPFGFVPARSPSENSASSKADPVSLDALNDRPLGLPREGGVGLT